MFYYVVFSYFVLVFVDAGFVFPYVELIVVEFRGSGYKVMLAGMSSLN